MGIEQLDKSSNMEIDSCEKTEMPFFSDSDRISGIDLPLLDEKDISNNVDVCSCLLWYCTICRHN